jgi:hypothetical protein
MARRARRLCCVDNNPGKWGCQFENLPVFPPESTHLRSVDVVLIASVHSDAIKEQLTKLGMADRVALDVPDLMCRFTRNSVAGFQQSCNQIPAPDRGALRSRSSSSS